MLNMNDSQVAKEPGLRKFTAPEIDSDIDMDVEETSTTSSSDDSEMEPFDMYLPKIEQLLKDIDFHDFSVEVLQHGYSYQNCVYALKPCSGDEEQYILRVPVCPDMDDTDSRCQAILNNVALLGYLADKMPVPRVKAFSAKKDNSLGAPFELQTRLPGQSLDGLYSGMTYTDKLAIVDQLVDLIKKLESISFTKAGTFMAPLGFPNSSKDCVTYTEPLISMFDEGDENFVQEPGCSQDRRGSDVKALLTSHLNGWIAKEMKGDEVHRSFIVPPFRRLLTMVENLCGEVPNGQSLDPVVLYHWDLEPRNIMVEKNSNSWRICGVIDWDDACAVPRALARKPPAWVWDFDPGMFTGYLDNDFHPKNDLSQENRALKAHFDAQVAASLSRYLEDSYGRGRWLRRVWTLVRNEIHTSWYLDLMGQLLEEWDERPQSTLCRSELQKGFWKKSLNWLSNHIQALR